MYLVSSVATVISGGRFRMTQVISRDAIYRGRRAVRAGVVFVQPAGQLRDSVMKRNNERNRKIPHSPTTFVRRLTGRLQDPRSMSCVGAERL
jgi:hypothetical protein